MSFRKAVPIAAISLSVCLAYNSHLSAQELDLGPPPLVDIQCLAESDNSSVLRPDPSRDGSWRQFRRDRRLSGRSPLIGNITCPEELWHVDLGMLKTLFSVQPGAVQAQTIPLPTNAMGDIGQAELNFEVRGNLLDLDGDGFAETPPTTGDYKIGEFMPTLQGLERVTCFDENIAIGDPVSCRLENYSNGDWQNVWTSDPLPEIEPGRLSVEDGRPIVGDFDNDGDLEIAVISWYEMYVLELSTGKLEETGVFFPNPTGQDPDTTPRAYGWFGAYDVDDDGRSEFIILGDRERSISVIGWVNGQFEEIWDHPFEAGTNSNETQHIPLARPVTDVDGDRLPEIITRVYNEHGDGLWHTLIYDAASGVVKKDLPGIYINGLADIDQNGVSELFLTEAPGQAVPDFGNISIESFEEQVLTPLWSSGAAGFISHNLPYPPDNINTIVVMNGDRGHRQNVFAETGMIAGNPVFVVRHEEPDPVESRVALYQFENGNPVELGAVTGPRLTLLAMSPGNPQQGILLRSITKDASEGPLVVADLNTTILASARLTGGDGSLAAARSLTTSTVVTLGTAPLIVTQRYDEVLVAYQLQGGDPVKMWEKSGRGMADGRNDGQVNLESYASVLLADVSGDSRLEIISAAIGSDGQAVMQALDLNGVPVWPSPSPVNVPGKAPSDEQPGITNWSAGNFRSNQFEDILVHYRVSDTGKYVRLLDGNTGDMVWERAFAKPRIGGCVARSGGQHGPVFDYDGDGLDDFLDLTPYSYVVYDGTGGPDLFNEWTSPFCPDPLPLFEQNGGILVGMAAVVDFSGNGSDQVLFGKNSYTLAVLRLDGTTVWNTTFYDGMPSTILQGIGDINGDGTLEVIAAGRCVGEEPTEAAAYDGATGDPLWLQSLVYVDDGCHNDPGSIVTGDINGDGRDEALFTSDNTVYAIGEVRDGVPAVLWTAEIDVGNEDATLGYIQIADVTGCGRPQILVNAGNGHLFSLGISITDTDGDCVPDDEDAFPTDPNESVDTDSDGTGNNADTDDDGDTMPDDYEVANGLDPLAAADAAADADGDGFTNLQEFQGGTNPQNPQDYPGVKRTPISIFILLDDEE